MIAANLICALGTFLFAYSDNFAAALFSRILMGFGSSFAFICLLVITITWFPRRYFAFFAGLSQFIGTLGPLLAGGPLIAYIIASHQSWQVAMNKVAIVGIILSILIAMFVKDKVKTDHYAKSERPAMQILWQLLKRKQIWYVAIYSSLVYISITLLAATWGTEYLQAHGLTQARAGMMISLAWVGYAIGCPMIGSVSDLMKRRKPSLLFCSALGLFSTLTFVYLSLPNWLYGVVCFCLGVAVAGQNVGFAMMADKVDAQSQATAFGFNNTMISVFNVTLNPLASYFIYRASQGHPTLFSVGDFTFAFSVMPILYLLSFLLAWLFIREG